MSGRTITGAKRRAVIVDDDTAVGAALRLLAERVGFWTTLFHNPEEALDAVGSGVQTELLLSDYTMPEMLGTDLAEALKVRGWDGSVIIVSGESPGIDAAERERLGIVAVIEKGGDLEPLERALRSVWMTQTV